MEVLNGMYGLERLPVLEPDDLFVRQPTAIKDSAGLGTWTDLVRRHSRAERPLHIILDLFPRFGGQVVCPWVVLQLELHPHHQMDNPLVNPVRPVVIQDLDILCADVNKEPSRKSNIAGYKPSSSNGRPLGFRSSVSPSPQRNLSLTTNRITDPYCALIWDVYSRYLRRSLGRRWKRSIWLASGSSKTISTRFFTQFSQNTRPTHQLAP
jgi:hypothetical protein